MIIQKESNLTESELQVAITCKWLRNGIPSMVGGEKIADWLENNRDSIESIFGNDESAYIKPRTPEDSKKLLEFVLNEKIGDEVEWIKCKESERWWLQIWWD